MPDIDIDTLGYPRVQNLSSYRDRYGVTAMQLRSYQLFGAVIGDVFKRLEYQIRINLHKRI